MKKIFNFAITLTLVIGGFHTILPTAHIKAESTDTIQTGDTVTLLMKQYGMSEKDTKILDLREFNGEMKKSPSEKKKDEPIDLSKNEKNLLARLVHAEAKGEPFAGKVAVATVVLNRVEHEQFPDTVKEVIYEENAFEPVQNGSINEPADKEAKKAVQVALDDQDKNDELLYFYNPETATSDWIFTREVKKTIGNHAFAI